MKQFYTCFRGRNPEIRGDTYYVSDLLEADSEEKLLAKLFNEYTDIHCLAVIEIGKET